MYGFVQFSFVALIGNLPPFFLDTILYFIFIIWFLLSLAEQGKTFERTVNLKYILDFYLDLAY